MENSNALDLFVKASDRVRELDIPSREAVEALTRSAMRMVATDLAQNNVKGAIDTMDKTRAVEEYIKAKVRQEHADLVTQNLVAACRFRIMREVGEWLSIHISTASKYRPGTTSYWLDDIGIDRRRSSNWQRIATLSEHEFESFLHPYIQPDNGTVDELIWRDVWSLANPRQPSEKPAKPALEVELSKPGEKLYLALLAVKDAVVAYFEHISKEQVPMREIFFLSGTILETRKGITAAETELRKLTRVDDAPRQN